MNSAGDERPIGSLFAELAQETSALLRTEARLARAEVVERINQFGGGLMMLVAGGLLLYAAFLVLLVALTLGLGQAFDWWATMPWLPPLVVGVAVAAAGTGLLLKGRGDVRPANLVPRRAVASVKEEAGWLRKKIR